ncbi:MAG: hypothetical protein COW13_02540 [Candidatus Omnitrophica bacterium CG12_big_fil_rev_8_21_14_0_65_50_5]|nr:MAG: hypothetical protein COW13_02540 [Candidatus Omnitrophica bacterium CG12_big_fil_rev_8_21_14_0_65_50_5]
MMSVQRTFTAAFLIVFAILSVVYLWFGLLFVLLLTVGGLYEFFSMMEKKGIPIYHYTGIAMGAAVTLITFFNQNHFSEDWNFYFILIGLFITFVLQFIRANNEKAVIGMATTLFGVLYVAWLSSFLIKIRFMLPGFDGAKLLGFIILVTKAGDIGALFVGSRIGRHPFLPAVSPNKTVEGALGSITFSVIAAVLGQSLFPVYFHVTLMQMVILGITFSVLGQFGDMAESLIKRDCEVKDSGKILPAMGGVLDVMDSLLFCAPVFYFYVSMILKSL